MGDFWSSLSIYESNPCFETLIFYDLVTLTQWFDPKAELEITWASFR